MPFRGTYFGGRRFPVFWRYRLTVGGNAKCSCIFSAVAGIGGMFLAVDGFPSSGGSDLAVGGNTKIWRYFYGGIDTRRYSTDYRFSAVTALAVGGHIKYGGNRQKPLPPNIIAVK